MNRATMAVSTKILRLFSNSRSTGHSRIFLHIAAEEPSTRSLINSNDPSSPVSQIVEILKLKDAENWKTDSNLNQLLCSSPLSAHQLLKISRHFPTSGNALKFVELLRSTPCEVEKGSLSSVFQAVFEIATRERCSADQLWRLVERSKEMEIPLSINSATLLIRRFNTSVERSMAVYNSVEPSLRNVHVRNLLLPALFQRGRLDDARKVLDEMLEPESEVCANGDTVKVVFEWFLKSMTCGKGVDEGEIVDLVSRLGERGLVGEYRKLIELIGESSRKGMKDGRFVVWELFHWYVKLGGPLEACTCNSLLFWLAKRGELNRFNLVIEEMEKNGILPDMSTVEILVNQLCRSGRMDESLEMLKRMTNEGVGGVIVKPDAVVYNMVIDGFCKVGKCREGLALMEKMKSEGSFVPNTSTYNCLINGFCRAGELEKSLELFELMKREKVEPNAITVNCLINGMCRNGRINTALKFFNEMKGKGLRGNVKSYTSLISAFCEANNINKAMYLFDEMKQICKPDAIVYYTLILGFCRAGRMDEAASIMSLMRDSGFRPDIGCYNTMISGFCKRKKVDRACELLKDMEMDGTKPDSITYNTMISYFSKSGDFKMAQSLLQRMVNDGFMPTIVTYGALIHAYCLAGNPDDAMKIFREMRIPPNTVIYNSLIHNFCKSRKVEEALFLFDDMEEKGVKPNTNTFNAMLKGLKDIKWLDKAFELMDMMICQGCDPDYVTMEVLTEWLPAVGETDRLKRFVQGFQVSDQYH